MLDFPNPDTYVCTYKTLTTFVLPSQVVLNLSNLSLAGHVVAEVRDKDNEPLIHLIGRGNVETVVSHDVIGRLMLMSVRQPGLAEVYRVVLGFDGDEFYSAHWKELNGVVFGETHLMLPDAIPIGVKSKDGGLELNPRHDRVMGPQDELVVLAEVRISQSPHSASLIAHTRTRRDCYL